MPETRVLLIGDASSDAIARVLAQHDRVLTRLQDPEAAIKVAPENQIIVVDVVPPPATIASVCRDLRAVPELAETPLLAISASEHVEERIRLLEAGADDVMARPIDERELDARIEALDLRFRRSKQLHPSTVVATTRREGHRLIVVFSPKGGAGTTTVALNLALAIASGAPGQVAIVDLAPGGAGVATHLDAKPRLGLVDMARDTTAFGDGEAVKAYFTIVGKLALLAGVSSPATLSPVTRENVAPILDTVLSATPTVVVDAGSRLDDRTQAVLELADNVVLVVTPDFPALQSVHAVLEHLQGATLSGGEPMVVVNELFAREMLTPGDIENALGKRVAGRIPHDPVLFQKAANEGSPVYTSAHGSPQARHFDELAAVLQGDDAPPADAERRPRRLGLFGRKRA